MHPTVCQLGPFTLSSYGLMLSLGFLLSIWLASRACRARDTSPARIDRLGASRAAESLGSAVPMDRTAVADWACWAVLGGILGGRVFYVVMNWADYASSPLEVFALWHGGLIWYGGFAGGFLASVLYWRRHCYPILRCADQVIPFVALGHAVGRIGCFLNGCCYGKPTSAWFGVRFPGHDLPVIPTQLFESAALVLLYLALRQLQRAKWLARPGTIFGAYLVAYAIIRWWLEYWRDQQVWLSTGLTLQQIISAVLFAIGIGLLVGRNSKPSAVGARQSALAQQHK